MKRSRFFLLLAFSLLGGLLINSGCKPPPRTDPTAQETPDLSPPTPPVGRHALTASPPVTVPDLDRLVGVGFTNEQIVSEIIRRGVLRKPDSAERTHILSLPRGDRLLDTMEAPANLLTADAATRYGQRQAGAPNFEQWQEARAASARAAAYPVAVQTSNVRQQQYAAYQRRRGELATQISTLKQQRLAMQRRGEIVAMITIQIERLERELAAIVPP